METFAARVHTSFAPRPQTTTPRCEISCCAPGRPTRRTVLRRREDVHQPRTRTLSRAGQERSDPGDSPRADDQTVAGAEKVCDGYETESELDALRWAQYLDLRLIVSDLCRCRPLQVVAPRGSADPADRERCAPLMRVGGYQSRDHVGVHRRRAHLELKHDRADHLSVVCKGRGLVAQDLHL